MVGHQEATWTIVQFIEEFGQPVECVPTKWIVGDTSFWPCRDVTKAIKNQEDVSEQWNCFKIRQLGKPCNDYLVARCMLNKAQDTSDLSGCEGEVSQKRKRFPRRVSSSEEDEEFEDRTRLPNFPASPELVHSTLPKNINAKIYKKQRIDLRKTCITSKISKCVNDSTAKTFGSDSEISPNNNSSFNDEVQLTNETIKTMPIIMIDHDITNLHQSSDLSQPSVTSFRALSRQSGTSDSNSEVQNDTTAFERQAMRQLVLLNAKVNQQTETLNYILEKLNQGTAVPLQNQEYTNFLQSDFFPIGSIEALENMEEQLQDEAKKKQLIIDLKKLGGEDTKKMIRRMLERLLTFKLGSMYTWDGARGKRVFGTLSISQVIKSACATTQRHNTTEDEVERFIKEWLRRAKERCIQTEKKKCMLPSNKQ